MSVHMLENPWFNLSHLLRKKVDIDIIIMFDISLRKIFTIKMYVRIS